MSESETDKPGVMKIDGKVYDFPEDFKIGELRTLKRFTGVPLDEVNWSDSEAIAAVAFILLRRENPTFSEDQLDERTVKFEEEKVKEEGEASPPDNGTDPATRPAVSGVPS